VIFGLIPIVGTVGLQIQQAAFSDRAQPQRLPLLSLQKLVSLSLVLGISFILGCLLSPFVHALSMRTAEASIPWVGILGLALGWATVFFVWSSSVAPLARNLYINHIELNTPRQKRRWLTRLSGVLLFPLFLWMCMVQIFFGAQAVNPALSSIPTLIIGSIISGGFALALFGIIWVISWRIGAAKGWFKKPQCSHCQSVINHQSGLLQHCSKCNRSIANWAWLPMPISFPQTPPPSIPVATAPPPL
jgi:hypothetical protein